MVFKEIQRNEKMKSAEEKIERVQALERGLLILDSLMESKEPIGVNELAKLQNITPSAAYRILKTLEVNGWVFQMENDKYITGEKLSYVTEKDNFYLALKETAYPVMESISKKEKLPMNLAIRQGRKFTVLQQSRSGRYVDFVAPVGSELPVHASAGGKILTCELPEVQLEDILDSCSFDSMTKKTINRKDEFIRELERVKAQKFALDYYESLDYTCCIAVPVRGKKGDIIAALSLSGIVGIGEEKELETYLLVLYEASEEITKRLFRIYERI